MEVGKMNKKIAVLLADGFEETEAIVPVDVWRRVGFDVVLIGISNHEVRGAHGIVISTDSVLDAYDFNGVDCVFLPGGMPGAANLRDSEGVLNIVREINKRGIVAAICAAPIVLAAAGILNGKSVTCYPGFEDQLGRVKCTGSLTTVDDNIITGKGPGAVFDFAAEVAAALGKRYDVEKVLKGMIV